MKKFFILSVLCCQTVVSSTLKIQNMRDDGLGTFVTADYGAPLQWYALDPNQSIQIDSGVNKIKHVVWYDPKLNVFFEIELNQPGVLITVDRDGNAGVLRIGAGGAKQYFSKEYKPNLGTPVFLQWNVIPY